MNSTKTYHSQQILEAEDLYELQDTFSSSGSKFHYVITEAEIGWVDYVKHAYGTAALIDQWLDRDTGIVTFEDPYDLREALDGDGMDSTAPMLSDDTSLQRLFFWLS